MEEEKEWIRLAKQGHSSALANLYQKHYPFLVKYLMKISMQQHLAEDIAQETMLKGIEKILFYDEKYKFSSWIISIATNTYIDFIRKQQRERKWREQNVQEQKEFYHQLRWVNQTATDRQLDLLEALKKVNEEHRIPIILKHYYGHSVEEISSIMGIPQGTVKSRIHNGLKEMRKGLEK